jgi:adenosylcobyric acid synthase
MLGKTINDPHKVESKETSVAGLGLLDIETTFDQVKTTTQVKARLLANRGLFEGMEGAEITGYEIHMGQLRSQNHVPLFHVIETPQGKADYFDGTASDDCLIFGSYIHGLFHNINFTRTLLNRLRQLCGLPAAVTVPVNKDGQYDELARIVRQNLDMQKVYKIALGREHA